MTRKEQNKILDDKIESNINQYKVDRLNAEISAFSSGDLNKYEFLTRKDLKYKPNALDKARFEFSPLVQTFSIGLDKTARGYQEEGVMKLLKDIRDGLKGGVRPPGPDNDDNDNDDNDNDDNDNDDSDNGDNDNDDNDNDDNHNDDNDNDDNDNDDDNNNDDNDNDDNNDDNNKKEIIITNLLKEIDKMNDTINSINKQNDDYLKKIKEQNDDIEKLKNETTDNK